MDAPAGQRTDTGPVSNTVLAERRGNVLVLTLNRPDRRNAWTDELEERYFGLLDEADADPDVRAVVVTGAGRSFCTGAELDNLAGIDPTEISALPARARPRFYPLTIRKPLIAAINGAAAGLGLVEALYCDVRFTTPRAKLTTSFARRGLIAEYGVAWLLPRLIGRSRALDLLLSARVVLGDEALALGLVDRVVAPEDLLEQAVAYATELATFCSPFAMQVIKQQVLAAMDSDFPTAATEADGQMLRSFQGADLAEGVASFIENRAPEFAGLAAR